jgi:oligoendopeptidase F
MAFKLTKDEDAQLASFKEKLNTEYDALKSSVDVFNDKVTDLQTEVDGKLVAYNETLSAFKGFVDSIASDKRGEIDEKSENWLQGDNGQAANDWVEIWEGADLEEVSIAFPDDVTVDFDNHGDLDLPSEA